MKNQLVILLDTDKDVPISIGKLQNPPSVVNLPTYVNLDIATLCEAIAVLINTAHELGMGSQQELLQQSITHINESVYNGITIDQDLMKHKSNKYFQKN